MTMKDVAFGSLFAEPCRNGLYKEKEHHGSGLKVVNMGEMFAHDRIGPQEMRRVEVSAREEQALSLKDGDLLFARRSVIRAGAGRCCLVSGVTEPTVFESSIIRVRLRAEVDPDYVFYFLRSPDGRSGIDSIVTGSAVTGIKASDLPYVTIRLPDLSEQIRVSRALRAIDDLIENNRRRISVIGEAIRALYDAHIIGAWQRATQVSTSAQPWERLPASSAAVYFNGYAFKPSDFAAAGSPIIKIRELKSGVDASTPRYDGELDDAFRVRAGDLLFSWSADLNVYIWHGEDGWLNQHLFVVRPKHGIPTSYLYLALERAMPDFRALSNGATMKHIKRSALDQVSILMAPPELRERFASAVDPMIELSIKLSRRITTLRKLRDLLLPKLLSGEIDPSRLPLPPEDPA